MSKCGNSMNFYNTLENMIRGEGHTSNSRKTL